MYEPGRLNERWIIRPLEVEAVPRKLHDELESATSIVEEETLKRALLGIRHYLKDRAPFSHPWRVPYGARGFTADEMDTPPWPYDDVLDPPTEHEIESYQMMTPEMRRRYWAGYDGTLLIDWAS